MERGCSEPSIGSQSWGTGCSSATPAQEAASKWLLAPWDQGLQGIRAGLIRLGWIRGQGSHPMAAGMSVLSTGAARVGDGHGARPGANPQPYPPKGGLVLTSQPRGNLG